MADPSVIERITLHLVDSLNGVRITAGASHDFDCQRRRRGGDAPTRDGATKVILDQFGDTTIPDSSQDDSGFYQQFGIDIFADSAEDLETPVDVEINALRADAIKALMGTPEARTRGGLAIDTQYIGHLRFTGSTHGLQVLFTVQYETLFSDPLAPRNESY